MGSAGEPITIGFVVNPIAGMGGRVALKGTDGNALEAAIARGAAPRAPGRAAEFAAAVARSKAALRWLTCGGPMGRAALEAANLPSEVVYRAAEGPSGAEDTRKAVRAFVDRGAHLIVFVGGDGTAKDVFDAAGDKVPLLGVPSGVKMHSGIFAVSPNAAADIVREFVSGRARLKQGEVVDEDEDALRQGRIDVRLRGVATTVAVAGLLQAAKVEYGGEVEDVAKQGIADHMVERMDGETLYIIGPGSTTGAVMEAMGLPHTLLGVDLVRGRALQKADATDKEIRDAVARHGGPAEILVGVIGAQGFVFGRGNLQISPEVIRAVGKKRITILAAEEKVAGLTELLVDTGDPELDIELSGHWRVLCGYRWNVFLPMRVPSAPT